MEDRERSSQQVERGPWSPRQIMTTPDTEHRQRVQKQARGTMSNLEPTPKLILRAHVLRNSELLTFSPTSCLKTLNRDSLQQIFPCAISNHNKINAIYRCVKLHNDQGTCSGAELLPIICRVLDPFLNARDSICVSVCDVSVGSRITLGNHLYCFNWEDLPTVGSTIPQTSQMRKEVEWQHAYAVLCFRLQMWL